MALTKDDAYAKLGLLKDMGMTDESILNEFMQALTTDEANDILDYIFKTHDLNILL